MRQIKPQDDWQNSGWDQTAPHLKRSIDNLIGEAGFDIDVI
jgi:hypothetical protein